MASPNEHLYRLFLSLGLKAQKISSLLFQLTMNSHPGKYFVEDFLGFFRILGYSSDCFSLPCTFEITSEEGEIEHSVYSTSIIKNEEDEFKLKAQDQQHNHVKLFFENNELKKIEQQKYFNIEQQDHFYDAKSFKIINYSFLIDKFTYQNKQKLKNFEKKYDEKQIDEIYNVLQERDKFRIMTLRSASLQAYFIRNNKLEQVLNPGSKKIPSNTKKIKKISIKKKEKPKKVIIKKIHLKKSNKDEAEKSQTQKKFIKNLSYPYLRVDYQNNKQDKIEELPEKERGKENENSNFLPLIDDHGIPGSVKEIKENEKEIKYQKTIIKDEKEESMKKENNNKQLPRISIQKKSRNKKNP